MSDARREILQDDPQCVEFYNACPEFQGALPPKKFKSQKHAKFGPILNTVNMSRMDEDIHNKAQLMQMGTRDYDARLKAHWEQNLSSSIPAVDTRHGDYEGIYSIYSVSFALARERNQSCTADSGKIMTF